MNSESIGETLGFDKDFRKLIRKLRGKTMVFELQPSGQFVETTGVLEILQQARQNTNNLIAKDLTLGPIDQFFRQHYHLAHKNLETKKHRLRIASFFPSFYKPNDTSLPVCYKIKSHKGDQCKATVKGSGKNSIKGTKESSSVQGTVSWKKSNPYLQRRDLVLKTTAANKKAKFILRIDESWKTKKIKELSEWGYNDKELKHVKDTFKPG